MFCSFVEVKDIVIEFQLFKQNDFYDFKELSLFFSYNDFFFLSYSFVVKYNMVVCLLEEGGIVIIFVMFFVIDFLLLEGIFLCCLCFLVVGKGFCSVFVLLCIFVVNFDMN